MENNKNKKSVKFQGDTLNFYDFIQVFVFTRNHHLNRTTNNLSIDKTDKKLFMQYLFQKRQLHRIEFSGAIEKAQVGG